MTTTARRIATFCATTTLALTGVGAVSASGATPASDRAAAPAAAASSNDAARGCRVPRCFGAISVSYADGAYGATYNRYSARSAKRIARRLCHRNSSYPNKYCTTGWVRNGCRAVALRRRRSGLVAEVRWSDAVRTKRVAKRQALRRCGANCRIRVWICTSRSY